MDYIKGEGKAFVKWDDGNSVWLNLGRNRSVKNFRASLSSKPYSYVKVYEYNKRSDILGRQISHFNKVYYYFYQ